MWAWPRKHLILLHVNNNGADQPAHPCKHFERKIQIIFMYISLNMCFWCSKEPSH